MKRDMTAFMTVEWYNRLTTSAKVRYAQIGVRWQFRDGSVGRIPRTYVDKKTGSFFVMIDDDDEIAWQHNDFRLRMLAKLRGVDNPTGFKVLLRTTL